MEEFDQKFGDVVGGLADMGKYSLLGMAIDQLASTNDRDTLREVCETTANDPMLQEMFSAHSIELITNLACAKYHGHDTMRVPR